MFSRVGENGLELEIHIYMPIVKREIFDQIKDTTKIKSREIYDLSYFCCNNRPVQIGLRNLPSSSPT